MKKYLKEIIILLLQLVIFYILPLFAGPTDIMGLILLIIFATLILSLIMGLLSKEKIKYLYPLVITILFIPSIFIYYNISAFIHCVWYFVIACIGLLSGNVTIKIINLIKSK